MKTIVAGSREFDNYSLLQSTLNKYISIIDEIVCGEARGADTLGKQWGIENKIKIKSFPANWEKYGKAAGHKRNEEMAIYADLLIAFWDGISKGTANMIQKAKKHNLQIIVINYTTSEDLW